MTINLASLKELCNLHSVVGDTIDSIEAMKILLQKKGITSTITPFGLLVFGNLKNPKAMITAHIDEIGFQVIKKNENGSFLISQSGHAYPSMLVNSHVYVQTSKGKIPGFIYPQKELGDYKADTFFEIFLDTLDNDAINIGDFGSYQRVFHADDKKVIATALDNKISIQMILELVDENPSLLNDYMFAFVTEEETTYDCITGLAHYYNPPYAIVLDMVPANQIATHKLEIFGDVGKGPAVLYSMHKYHLHPEIKKKLDNSKLKFQKLFVSIDFPPEPQLAQRNGITKGINIMVPMHGWHSSAYTMMIEDYTQTKQLVADIIPLITT
ncbi:M42 family metallopeptidase [soil metagenome]